MSAVKITKDNSQADVMRKEDLKELLAEAISDLRKRNETRRGPYVISDADLNSEFTI